MTHDETLKRAAELLETLAEMGLRITKLPSANESWRGIADGLDALREELARNDAYAAGRRAGMEEAASLIEIESDKREKDAIGSEDEEIARFMCISAFIWAVSIRAALKEGEK